MVGFELSAVASLLYATSSCQRHVRPFYDRDSLSIESVLMPSARMVDLPEGSRIRISHCDGATLIHIAPPGWGILVFAALGIPLLLVPKILAELGRAQGKAGAKSVPVWIWIVGIMIFCLTVLILVIVNRKWPHVIRNWFYRSNVLVEPGRIAISFDLVEPLRTIAISYSRFSRKSDAYGQVTVNSTARHIEIRAQSQDGSVYVCGTDGSLKFGEALSNEERDWLVGTINSLVNQRTSGSPANRKAVPKREAPKSFDAFQIAADTCIVIEKEDAETLRFHYPRRRGVLIWILALFLMACSVGGLSACLIGSRNQDRAQGPDVGLIGKVGGVACCSMFLSYPALLGLVLVASRVSVVLTSDELVFRRHLGPLGRRRNVPTREIEAITTLDFPDRAAAARFRNRTDLSQLPGMTGCVIRIPNKHLDVPIDDLVAPVVRSLLLGKLACFGRDVSDL